MEAVDFSIIQHLPDMYAWLGVRGHSLPSIESIPALGRVVYNEDKPVAIGFIRRVEGGYGQFDGLVSNPDMPGHIRHEALTLIVKDLIQIAKTAGICELMAFTADKNTLERAVQCGFSHCNSYAIVSLDTSKDK